MDGVQLVQEDILISRYIMFGFEPLHNVYMGISKLFEKCNFNYLESYAIESHSGKTVQERSNWVGCGILFYKL